jgi:hypothetical protein
MAVKGAFATFLANNLSDNDFPVKENKYRSLKKWSEIKKDKDGGSDKDGS